MSGDLRQAPASHAGTQRGGFQLQLLGEFSLRRERAPIELPPGPQRLLAFIAVNGPAPRPVIMGTLWPEVSEPRARGSLRTAMWRLHRAAPGLLRPARHLLGLHPGVRVDIRVVSETAQGILQDARQLPAGPGALRARGELLPGWFDDWVIFERERIRQLQLHALDALAERYSRLGRYPDALESALDSARIEPLRESPHRMIIAIHLAEGNAAEAVRHYRFFRDLLRAELGLAPSAQLTAMLPGG
jgi:DNA-binding SARP family transcriptional activator